MYPTGTKNKQMQLNELINNTFPSNPWSFTGEYGGQKWQFLVMYSPGDKPTDVQEEKLKQLAAQIDPSSILYVLPYQD